VVSIAASNGKDANATTAVSKCFKTLPMFRGKWLNENKISAGYRERAQIEVEVFLSWKA